MEIGASHLPFPSFNEMSKLNSIITEITQSNQYTITKGTQDNCNAIFRSSTLTIIQSIDSKTIHLHSRYDISTGAKANLIKLALLALSDFIHNNSFAQYQYALSIIQLLFKQGFFIESEAQLLFCFILRLTIEQSDLDYIKSAFTFLSNVFSMLVVNTDSIKMVKGIAEFLIKINANEVITFKLNRLNLFSLFQFDSNDINDLTTPIVNFIRDISLFQYDSYLFDSLISSVINQFGRDSLSKVPSRTIHFIQEIIEKEFEKKLKDDYHFFNRFYYSINQSKGISTSEFTFPDSPYTIVFSFKSLIQNSGNMCLPLIAISPIESTQNVPKKLMIYVNETQKLCIKFNDIINTDIPILPNKSYVVLISQNRSLFNIQVNNVKKEFSNSKINQFKSEKCSMRIGHFDNNSKILFNKFHGYFGTVIFYNNYFTSEMIEYFNKLKGQYDLLLECNKVMSHMNTTVSINSKAMEYFMQNKQMDHIVISISSQYVNISKIDRQRNSISAKDNNTIQLKINQLKCSIDEMIYPYALKLTLDEFLKLEGVRFIQLHLEYYQQLLENIKTTKNDALLEKISTEVSNIFSLIKLLLELTDTTYFLRKPSPFDSMCTFIDLPLKDIKHNSNEIIYLFGSYSNVLLSISLISPKHIESNLNELLSFISVCVFQEDSNELLFTLKTKLIYFMFNKTLYQSNNKHQLSHFVSTISDCINKNPKGLFNKDFLMAMLTFTDDIIEGYGGMLRTYLEISFEQSHELFLCFFYIIANEEKDIKLLVKMLLTLFAFCSNLPLKDRYRTLSSISLDKLIMNKIQDLNSNNSQREEKSFSISVLIQLMRFIQIDTNRVNGLLTNINMNSIVFRSVLLLLYQTISTQEFLTTISSHNEFQQVIINDKSKLTDKDLLFWFENVIKCYMRLENDEMKTIAYEYIIGLIENQLRVINDSHNLSKLYDVFHSKNVFAKFFYQKGLDKSVCNDLLRISKLMILKHPKPFIFSLLFKFYIQNEVKATIGRMKQRHHTVPNKEEHNLISSDLAETDTQPVSIEIDIQTIEDNSVLYFNNTIEDSSWESQIDNIGQMINSLFECMVSQLKYYHEQSTEDFTMEIRKNILVNNVNLYIFLYKVFCLQKSFNDKRKKMHFFKAIESHLIINSHNFYFYSLPFLRIAFPIGKKTKFLLEILFDLYNEFMLLTDNKKYYEHFISFLTFDLNHSSLLCEADALFMFNTKPSSLCIDKNHFLQLENLIGLIPKLKKEDISLTLFYLIKFSIVLIKDETVNQRLYIGFYSFLQQFTVCLFNETQMLFSSIKKTRATKSDYAEQYYVRIKREIIEKKKWSISDFNAFIAKIRVKEGEDIDKVFSKLLFNKAGHIIQEETIKRERKSFMFGRASIDSIPRKLSGEEDLYPTPFNNETNSTAIKAKDIYAKLLKEQKFDLEYKCDYFLFNFPVWNIKKTLLHIIFAYHFRNVLFFDEGFIELKKEFKTVFRERITEPNSIGDLPYPTKLKNFSLNYMRLFLKPGMSYLFKNPQLVRVAYRDLHYQSVSQKKLRYFKNQLNNIKLPNHIVSYWGELVSVEGSSFGLISLSKNYLQFKAYSEMDPRLTNKLSNEDKLMFVLSSLESDVVIHQKSILFRYSSIKLLLKKRYIYAMISSEFFLSNGRSYFFNLFTEEKNDSFLSSINSIANKNLINISQSIIDRFILNDYPAKWQRGDITTFDYLLLLNITSRSFNDNNQYPVFPWIEAMDLNNNIIPRDFEFPLSVQDEKKRKQIIFQSENIQASFKNHFNTHFSTSSFVIYYLIRINPFSYNMIKLQNGVFDLPGRIFHSYEEILVILQQFNDNRELVPEVFYFPEMFLNLNYFNYGIRQHDNIQLHNVLLKNMNPASFVLSYRKMLDSPHVAYNIHKWIDNIFGVKQINTTKGSCNTYMKFCYEEKMSLINKINSKLKKNIPPNEIWNKIRNKISLILNFGQTPQRIFKVNHPIIISNTNAYSNSNEVGQPTPSNQSSFSVISIEKDFIYFKEIVTGTKQKAVLFLSKTKEVFNSLIAFDKATIKPKRFTFEYVKYIDNKTNARKIREFYCGRNIFEIFTTSIGEVSLFCNYYDKSIKFYSEIQNEAFEFILESFTTAVEKTSESKFITGHINGKVLLWEFEYNQISKRIQLNQLNSFLQKSSISLIVYCAGLNLIFTADNDGHVCIRSLATLELLTLITPKGESHKRCMLITKITISRFNYVYISGYDCLMREFYLFGYTLNGVLFSKTKMLSQDFQLLPNDTILIFGRNPQNKPRFISINPTNFNEVTYYSNSSSITQVSHFLMSIEKNYIYIIDYHCAKLQIALLSEADMINYCFKPF